MQTRTRSAPATKPAPVMPTRPAVLQLQPRVLQPRVLECARVPQQLVLKFHG